MKYIRRRRLESFLENLIGKAQKKLHMFPSPRLYVQIDTLDADGNVVAREEFKSNSFVRNALNIAAFQIGAFQDYKAGWGDSFSSLKNLSGTQLDLANSAPDSNESASCCRVSGTGSSSYQPNLSFSNAGGVILGASDNAESLNDYMLGDQIANGTAPGQLSYGALSQTSGAWDSVNRLVWSAYSRTFTNGSGSSVIVKEIGLLNKIKYGATTQVSDVLWARDVLPAPITIANGEAKTFTYTVKFPF